MLEITPEGIIFTVINLLILTVAFKIILFKPIQKIIAQRQAEVDNEFAEVAQIKEEANELKEKYQSQVDSIEKERKDTLKKAKKTADEEYNKIIEQANKDAHEIRKRARATGESQREQILKDTEKEIAEMALAAASKAVAKQTGSDIDSDLYDQFLKKAGE